MALGQGIERLAVQSGLGNPAFPGSAVPPVCSGHGTFLPMFPDGGNKTIRWTIRIGATRNPGHASK